MIKKNYLLSLLTTMMVAMLSLGFVSCGGDDDDSPTPKPNDGNEQTDVVSNQDPEGTIVVNMNNGAKDNWIDIGICTIHIDDANNFVGRYSDVEFTSVGKVKGLSNVTTIPSTGWSKSSAVVPGTGYVVKCGDNYARMYVVDYTVSTAGGIMGATVKYQSPFQLPIILESSSLTFTSGASSQSVRLKNPTSVSVEGTPVWCTVSTDINSITVSVTENLSAQQYSGDITLKNSVSSIKLSVIQKGSSSPKFEGGRGTADDPYQIKTAQQLDNVRIALNSHFVQTADITLGAYLDTNGSGWEPIGKDEARFRGTIDGNNHLISGIWINRATTDHIGLFGFADGANIKGVKLIISAKGINGQSRVGGIAGAAHRSNIECCFVSGAVTCNNGGAGICGEMYSSKISECYTEGKITAYYETVSGISFCDPLSIISNCYSTMLLEGGSGNSYLYAKAIGGGEHAGTVTKCYFAGKVFNVANRTPDFNCSGTYTYCDAENIGSVHYDYMTTSNNTRTTSQMMTQANYEGWDFVNIWKIIEGKTYPTLRCFDK